MTFRILSGCHGICKTATDERKKKEKEFIYFSKKLAKSCCSPTCVIGCGSRSVFRFGLICYLIRGC